jgi:type VI secretion system Hcp family effector
MRKGAKSPLFLPLVVALLSLPGAAFAGLHMLIQATGTNQGTILGDATVPGHENWITALSFSHGVSVPTGSNGEPVGPPSLSELNMMKGWDRSIVKLMKAQVDGETFSSFKLEYVDDALAKMPMTLIRFELTGARITSVQESGSSSELPSVSLSFTYSRITIIDVVQGTTVSYDWNPVQAVAPDPVAKGILLAPSPNPTQGRTEFRFSLPADSNAELTLFDLRGHRVRELFSGWTSSEPTVAVWDGTDDRGMKVAQGMYVARLVYPGKEITQRLTVLR